MVIYDLICEHSHEFEGWFKNADEFGQQQKSGLLTCPFCDSYNVVKKPTAAKVTKKTNAQSAQSEQNNRVDPTSLVMSDQSGQENMQHLRKMMQQVHEYIDNNFEDVGHDFAKQALSMHRGEQDPANIRGTATRNELSELDEEGVQVVPVPAKPLDKKKLN